MVSTYFNTKQSDFLIYFWPNYILEKHSAVLHYNSLPNILLNYMVYS